MIIKKYLKLLLGIVFIVTLFGFVRVINTDSVYISTATLEPKKSLSPDTSSSPFSALGSSIGSPLFGGTNKSNDVILALELIRSKDFFEELLKVDGFSEKLNNPIRTNFLRTYQKKPSNEMLTFDNMHARFLNNHLSIKQAEKTSIVTIRINHFEAETAKSWLDIIILKLNTAIRNIRVEDSSAIVEALEQELSKQSVPEVRYSLANLMAKEVRSIALAGLGDEFVFKIVDSPRVSDKRARPSRTMSLILWFILGLVISFSSVLLLSRLSIHKDWM